MDFYGWEVDGRLIHGTKLGERIEEGDCGSDFALQSYLGNEMLVVED
jgi:hypothetical protein